MPLSARDVDRLGNPDALTIPEFAAIFRIGRRQAYGMVTSGQVYAVRIGRSIRVPKREVERLLAGERLAREETERP